MCSSKRSGANVHADSSYSSKGGRTRSPVPVFSILLGSCSLTFLLTCSDADSSDGSPGSVQCLGSTAQRQGQPDACSFGEARSEEAQGL